MRMFSVPSDHSSLELTFEFFPPKSEKARVGMLDAAARLKQLIPGFCSVTYGACGSNQAGTLDSALAIADAAECAPAAHLTCVGASRQEIDAVALKFRDAGIRRIVALRGDPQETPDTTRAIRKDTRTPLILLPGCPGLAISTFPLPLTRRNTRSRCRSRPISTI